MGKEEQGRLMSGRDLLAALVMGAGAVAWGAVVYLAGW